MKQILSILFFSFFVLNYGFSQQKVKFGKIDKADLEMMYYPTDSSAAAAILHNTGFTQLEYDKNLGDFVYSHDRHFRIKILDKAGLDWADFTINLYKNGSDQEKLTKFVAIVANLKNGKIEETKVVKKDLFSQATSEHNNQKKIAFPKVQVGSIIDIKYTVLSPFYITLTDWQFQHEIPVRYSEYRVDYPEWFTYKAKFKGYDTQYITTLDLSPTSSTIVLNPITRRNAATTAQTRTINYSKMRHGWVANEMPAFVEEAYISTVDNFLVAVDFELSATDIPGSSWTSYARTWEELGQTMMQSSHFGKQLNKSKTKFLSDEVKSVTEGFTTPEEKVAALYYFLKSKVAWNGSHSAFIETSLKEAYNQGKGNSADINLMLMGILQQAGFKADAILLSTKGHGFLNPAFPSLRQFNYVIVRVEIAPEKYMLLDATNKSLPMHLLPPKCINDSGLLVRKEGIKWVDLTNKGKYYQSRSMDLTLNEDMDLEGSMKVRCKDYAAYLMRENYIEEGNETDYMAAIESNNEGLSIRQHDIENIQDINKSVKETSEVTISNQVMEGGDLLYLNPMLTFGMEENPFTLEERTYPVDYPYAQSKVYALNLTIPEGYAIEEIPESKAIAMPEKSGNFNYTAKVQGNKLTIVSQFKINKNLFLPTEYQSLKAFYNIVIEKHSEQIVLKKL